MAILSKRHFVVTVSLDKIAIVLSLKATRPQLDLDTNAQLTSFENRAHSLSLEEKISTRI